MSNIWLTRPLQQADDLIAALSAGGANVLHLPMLEIEALVWDAKIKNQILNYDQYDLAIFISSNAARVGLDCINNYWPQHPSHIKHFALGATSAAVLQNQDLQVTYPDKVMSSEAVLELSQLSETEVAGKKVLIFRGEGGREMLAEKLRERGAAVDYVELYRRNLPEYSLSYLHECIHDCAPDTVVISSAEALENFIELFQAIWPELLTVSLLTSSERIKDIAIEKGFKNIMKMSGANDEAIILSLGANAS